jgi:hypothetical protein
VSKELKLTRDLMDEAIGPPQEEASKLRGQPQHSHNLRQWIRHMGSTTGA